MLERYVQEKWNRSIISIVTFQLIWIMLTACFVTFGMGFLTEVVGVTKFPWHFRMLRSAPMVFFFIPLLWAVAAVFSEQVYNLTRLNRIHLLVLGLVLCVASMVLGLHLIGVALYPH